VETGPVVLLNSSAPPSERQPSARFTLSSLKMLLMTAPPKDAVAAPGWKRSCLEIGLRGLLDPMTVHADAGAIPTPLLVVSGAQDTVVSHREALSLYHHYPTAEFHGFADLGHWLLDESGSGRVLCAMSDWLSSLDFYREDSAVAALERKAHHGRPKLYPARKQITASKRSRRLPASWYPGRLQSNLADSGAEEETAILPR
ncbi:MAG: hypothetical protein AAF357_15660, partial [Verrucomicrobiota bacterium]